MDQTIWEAKQPKGRMERVEMDLGCSFQGHRVMSVVIVLGKGRGVAPRKCQAGTVNKCHELKAASLGQH